MKAWLIAASMVVALTTNGVARAQSTSAGPIALVDSTGKIASALFVAPVTIRSHIAAIVRKLEVRDRDEALAVFQRQRASQAP